MLTVGVEGVKCGKFAAFAGLVEFVGMAFEKMVFNSAVILVVLADLPSCSLLKK